MSESPTSSKEASNDSISQWTVVFEMMKEKGNITLLPGLSDKEFKAIEAKYKFTFPPDLRSFYQEHLPIGNGWINWRKPEIVEIEPDDQELLNEVLQPPTYMNEVEINLYSIASGILFDILNNDAWLSEFGEKPSSVKDALVQAHRYLKSENVPKLIPICTHRFIPSLPNEIGNPVFSIMGTDAIVYGYDLKQYLINELTDYTPCQKAPKWIPFWSSLCGETQVVEDYWGSDDEENSEEKSEEENASKGENKEVFENKDESSNKKDFNVDVLTQFGFGMKVIDEKEVKK
ncbi:uncharacterized protein MONOS_247 [Monocercomonoides exilis]|uniref:uncharacterized protein n=1 Tax=Monocercomonoides exilis TaxID=2049356 RepID=UPI00355AA7CF|nr:hypothetical protein MONOS_247 [Monocercomonoides exilis]|eukprot:MONOS_247.1-p1 / transcript=MONOS_247.1 / gene=MONOS_247 / organism=Monocercomonoides_exilis_PA203 / gene_product=putative integron gene cassette protein / transcript_product=putative integron gene cassette protein / location=Mono_scaffold00004:117971-119075(-) / protein_length=288 / sequence_SO=supercontig / SO=protein_coding / is_pseudo=false